MGGNRGCACSTLVQKPSRPPNLSWRKRTPLSPAGTPGARPIVTEQAPYQYERPVIPSTLPCGRRWCKTSRAFGSTEDVVLAPWLERLPAGRMVDRDGLLMSGRNDEHSRSRERPEGPVQGGCWKQ